MKFKNEFYNQIKGTAIGTVFAPTYVTLLMRHFEIKLCSIYTANMEKRQLNILRKAGTVFWMAAIQF